VLTLSRRELRRLRAEKVGMVYQNPGAALNPSVRIGQQLAEVFTVRGVPKTEALERAREELVHVQIADPGSVLERYPHQLSGGMQQRVGLARALVRQPEILLMDEPFGALDAQTRALLQDELQRLWAQTRSTVVFVTHDLDEAIYLADRVVILTKRPGRVKQLLTVDLPRPRYGYDARAEPEFLTLRRLAWNSLKEELLPR